MKCRQCTAETEPEPGRVVPDLTCLAPCSATRGGKHSEVTEDVCLTLLEKLSDPPETVHWKKKKKGAV